MKKGNEKEFECVVYEPVKRTENENLEKEKEDLKVSTKYSGLYNRGNTCYLNSLIQSLFMTPEFRLNILKRKFDPNIHGKIEDNIPFQLQKLFARLQLRLRDCEMTEDLTKSFDWGNQQLLEQHDIQELCRVLFEAIEVSLYQTEDNFINNLYQGFSTSVVKCLECKKESEKKDRFLDISLPVRDEYEHIYNTSLEMAFKNFLKEEKLEKDNQYNCTECNKKVDALKFIKFTKLPQILFLQLNRFEYDYLTDSRRKICDRVSFPMVLNMNSFMTDFNQIEKEFSQEKLNKLEIREEIKNVEELIETYLKEGEHVYELFSIVVHSGSARGGHYYSFIKSYEDKKWYRFDDNLVYDADLKNILHTFGEITRTGLNAVTGYILMYRKVDIENNFNLLNDLLITQNKELMEIIELENNFIAEEEERQKEKMNTFQLKFVYDDKTASIQIKKTNSIRELKLKVMKEFGLNECLYENNLRIRCVHNQTYKMLDAFNDENLILDDSLIVSHKTYALEIKKEEESFEDYNPDVIVMNVCKWNDEIVENKIEEKSFKFDKIRIDKKLEMKELKHLLLKFYCLSNQEIFVIKKVDFGVNNYQINELFTNEEEMNKNIHSCLLSDNSKLFLEFKNENWISSKFIKYFEENCANIIVRFNFPIKKEENISNGDLKVMKKPNRITFNSYKFENEIEIKKSKTIGDIKNRIAEFLKLSENEFIMKKSSHNGNELKNLYDPIDKFATHAIDIYIEFGSPQKDSEVKINLFTCEYDYSFFLLFPYRTVDVGFFLVDIKWTILELKSFIINELKKKSIKFTKEEDLNNVSLNEILIREYKNDRPTKIFRDENILGKDLQFTENKKIIIQRYKETYLNFNQGDIQLTIREWDPSNWKISNPIEMHFVKGLTFLEFSYRLNQIYPHLIPEKISAFKVINEMNVYMDDLKKYKFENLYEKNDFVLDHYPFFVNADGCIIIIKDDTKILRDPKEEEIRLYCRPKQLLKGNKNSIYSNSSYTSNSSTSSKISNSKSNLSQFKTKTKEKGVVIKVKNNQTENLIKEDKINLDFRKNE